MPALRIKKIKSMDSPKMVAGAIGLSEMELRLQRPMTFMEISKDTYIRRRVLIFAEWLK